MYKNIKKTIEEIIEEYGDKNSVEDFLSEDVRLKIKKPSFQTFSLEKCGDTLFAGYYTEMNGDLVSDPIFVFKIIKDKWYPERLEQFLGDTNIGYINDGDYHCNKIAFNEVEDFANLCSKEWDTYYLKDTEGVEAKVLRE